MDRMVVMGGGGRRDLRHTHLVVSIDPKGCEDVDDALSIRYVDHMVERER